MPAPGAIKTPPPVAAVLATLLLFTACGVTVRDGEQGERTEVDIETPLGDVSVRTDVDSADTGLPVYPGARPLRDGGEPKSADVNIGTSFFGVKVVAAKFEDDDAPEAIVNFYKEKMSSFGAVTECRGNLDFKGRRGSRRPVCKERPFRHEIQLVAGTEERHRIVVVKPRGSGSEFAVIYIQTHGRT